jgi:hypothetical protein
VASASKISSTRTPRSDEVLRDVAPPDLSSKNDVGRSGSDAAPPASNGVRRPINLGLDGSIVRSKLLEKASRPPARRSAVVYDLWSESVVRSAAKRAAPREGTALLVIEWDSAGKLQSIASSAKSSNDDSWRQLAETLRSRLSKRPGDPGRSGGLRLVYLVRAEIVEPASKRSVLPRARYASAEQIKDDLLPPANAFNVGIKADSDAAAQRVVSVTLASSQAL